MAERAYNVVQVGIQSAHGTPAAATKILPVEPGVIEENDRGYNSPQEDFGRVSRHQPGRPYYGMRGGTLPLNGEVTFEDIIRILTAHAGAAVITSTNTPTETTTKTHTYTFDETSDTKKRLSIEAGTLDTAQDEWLISDGLVDELEIGFEDITVPGASPWTYRATVIGKGRSVSVLTGSLSAPALLETAQGHLTTLFEGTNATAYGSLSELAAHLVGYKMRSTLGLVRRAYGGSDDEFDAFGYGKAEVTVTARVKISASSKSDIYDIYNAAGAPSTSRRWRIKALGSTVPASNPVTAKSIVIDHQLIFENVVPSDRDGEDVYEITAYAGYDATLGSRAAVAVTNNVATLP